MAVGDLKQDTYKQAFQLELKDQLVMARAAYAAALDLVKDEPVEFRAAVLNAVVAAVLSKPLESAVTFAEYSVKKQEEV